MFTKSEQTNMILEREFGIDEIVATIEAKDYKFFSSGAYNINMIGIRSDERNVDDTFRDALVLVYREQAESPLIMKRYKITTLAGEAEMVDPSFQEAKTGGTAILVPNQYFGAWEIGIHGAGKWAHEALIQHKAVQIYRDKNRDKVYDCDPKSITEGWYGIDIHASVLWPGEAPRIMRNSAGCQVFARYDHYQEWLWILKKAAKEYSDVFSYTLLEEKDLFP